VLVGIYLTSLYNYLLFQTIVELSSIVICAAIFMVAWNSRKYSDNHYLTFVGIAFLFVAMIDMAHILTVKGMPFFPFYGTNETAQLWTAARYVQSLSLLFAPVFIKRKLNVWVTLLAFMGITAILLSSIMVWRIFPVCYVEGEGLTFFKIGSEFVICAIFIMAGGLLWISRKSFDSTVLILLLVSISFGIEAECAFMFYREPTGIINVLGQLCYIVSFYFIYRALVVIGLQRPYDMLFYNLSQGRDLLRKERDKLDNLLDLEESMLVALDKDQKVTLINRKGTEILGTSEDDIIGKPWFDTFFPVDKRKDVKDYFNNLMNDEFEMKKYTVSDILNVRGELRTIAWHNSLIRDEAAKITGTFSSGQDITERKEAEDLFRAIFNTSPVGMYIAQDVRFRMINPQFEKYIEFTEKELIGTAPLSLVLPEDQARVRQDAIKALKARDQFKTYEYRVKTKSGKLKWFMESLSSIHYEGMRATLGTIIDVTELKQSEELFKSLSVIDDLTGLYNRRGFVTLAAKQLKLSYRMKKDVTLLFADINKLKWINDNLGHLEGDSAIMNAARILKDTFRETDVVARMSGDEFAVFMTGSDENYSNIAVARLEQKINEFNVSAKRPYQLSMSLGLAAASAENQLELNELIDIADRLMYANKRETR
jgi:diguanylate cyclase (GGDEF)-like protein/PAS domain S-box-containing protein